MENNYMYAYTTQELEHNILIKVLSQLKSDKLVMLYLVIKNMTKTKKDGSTYNIICKD